MLNMELCLKLDLSIDIMTLIYWHELGETLKMVQSIFYIKSGSDYYVTCVIHSKESQNFHQMFQFASGLKSISVYFNSLVYFLF